MSNYSVFTSESVSEGHPDKLADQISDAIVDAMLKDDPESRIAVETMFKQAWPRSRGNSNVYVYRFGRTYSKNNLR